MSSSQWSIRNFLICQPAPTTIRMTSSSGEVQEMKPGRKSRSKLAETIAATDTTLLECLDADGLLLRAMRVEETDQARSVAAPIAQGLQQDPETLRVTHFANLLHRAYEHATDIAFAKLIELVERMDARTESIEARLERTEAHYRREQQERIDDLWDRAEEKETQAASGENLMNAFMGSAAQGMAAASQNGSGGQSNGKGQS
jgi:hypothetical protein